MHNRPILTAALFVGFAFLASCTAGVNPGEHQPDGAGHIAGIFAGLWHGLIIVPTLFLSFFFNGISIYDAHNNGGWYDLGYVLGLCISLGGGGTVVIRTRG